MSNRLSTAFLFSFAISTLPAAVSAFPLAKPGAQAIGVPSAVTKAGCYDDCCDCCCSGSSYWRPRYYGYWRPRYRDWPENYHSRYYSHYRWGSYHRLWRPYYGGWED